MPRPIITTLLAALLAGTLAACGGSDETTTADYRADYAPISAAIRGLGTDVGGAVTAAKGKSDVELQEQFADLADRANGVAGELERAPTPDDATITATRTALVAGLRRAAGDLDAISGAAAAGDAAAAKAATMRLAKDSAAIRDPRRKLDQLVLSAD